jgi:hypothetical protein
MNAKDRIMSPLAGGSASTVPRRILHVVPGLERGGIEMWLMNVLRSIDAVRYPMDFGVVLRLAARHQVPIRIAHSHNNTRPAEARASWPRRS